MRRLALACLLLVVGLAGCGGGGGSGPRLTVTHPRQNFACAGACYSATLGWGDLNFASTTGYLVTQDGVQKGDVSAHQFTFAGLSCGTSYTLAVQPHNSGGGTGTNYSTAYTTPPCGGGSPLLSCTGSNVTTGTLASRVASATPGDVLCLTSGDYSSFAGGNPASPGITLTAAAGAAVTFNAGITLNLSTAQNITLDGSGGGGTMTIGGVLDLETNGDAPQDKAVNLTFQNIAFTAGSVVDLQGEENSNITFNRDTFINGNANCDNGGTAPSGFSEQVLLGGLATPTTPSGVTFQNSVFVSPMGLWNPFRAIQTAAPMTIRNNVFTGYVAHTQAASCNHIDTLQWFSGLPGTVGNVTFTGNVCYADYGCVLAFDGTSNNTITDNACFSIERACVTLYSDAGSVVDHNTMQTGGADPGGCANTVTFSEVACTSPTLIENSHKAGDPVGSGEVVTNNVSGASGQNIGDPSAVATNTNNLFAGATAPNISGAASFVAGSTPATWAGFALTAGSAGHAAGSDGLDVGIRSSAGGTPTGGGSAPVNTVAPAVSGSAAHGTTLSSTTGAWSSTGNVPTATTYQWFDCPTSTFSLSGCSTIEPATTVTSGSNGVATSSFTGSGTLNVTSTGGFDSSGQVRVQGVNINYTGITGTSFTGCTTATGTATLVTGATVIPSPYPTSNTGAYTLTTSDVGKFVFSYVTVTNANGQVSAASNAVGPVS